MLLNEELQAIQRGEQGDEMARVLNTLVMYGEAFGAERMVKITGKMGHAVIGTGSLTWKPVFDLMDRLIKGGALPKQSFTTDPRGIEDNVPVGFAERMMFKLIFSNQKRMEKEWKKMGIKDDNAYTCTAYMEEVFGKAMCETWFHLVDAVMAGEDTFACPDQYTYDWVMGQFPIRCFPVLTELIDFAYDREHSVIDGVPVHAARKRAGAALAQTHPVRADVVVGVPDSGLDAAIGYSQASGIPYGIGLIKNKYIGRTFIAPDARADQVRIKLAPIRETVEGKIVILIDDSIVRGTTCGRIVRLLRDAGAKEVHMRVTAPPFLHPCYYGTDIDSRESLIACHHSVPGICRIIGADSLGYLPVDKLQFLAGHENYCSACFSGKYPTPVPQGNCKRKFEQRLAR